MAEWTTGLNEQMDQLIRDMKEEIGKLDMSEEAKESGRATVQAYIDQAEGMLPQVRSAYANVARAASLALGPAAPLVPVTSRGGLADCTPWAAVYRVYAL